MSIAQKALRDMKVIHAALLLAAILYVWVPSRIVRNSGTAAPMTMVIAIGVVALSSLGIAVFLRRRMVQPAVERLSKNPEDGQAAARWRAGVVLSLVFCESVALFGLVLRMMGAGWNVCGIFYVAGISLLLVWTPRLDLPP